MAKSSPSQTSSSKGPSDHSTLVGGSTADRRIGCAASYVEENKVPAHIRDKSSSYADEGTALHAVMQFIFENDVFEEDLEEQILGREFEGYIMTQELIDTAILPCMDYIAALQDELSDEGEFRFELETKCQMPGIPGAFGTSDFIFRTDKRSGVLDYKFGEGVPVKASYIEQDGTVRGNSQLLYYGRAAQNTLPHMFEDDPDWPVEVHILQPRARDAEFEDKFTMFETTAAGLEQFRLLLVDAIAKAQGPSPTHRKGPWCRFAACKTVCPLHTGALIDMSKLAVLQAHKDEVSYDFEANLGVILELWHMAEVAGKAALAQAQEHLEQGGRIVDPLTGEPGWKLVPKRGVEKVVDESGMVRHALSLGLDEDKVFEPRTARSPAQLGAVLEPMMDATEFTTKKAREAEARRQLREFTITASSGNTLARMDDRRPEVTPTPELVNSLADKLAALQKK